VLNGETRVTPRALTIAGSDSGGGAGIQADLKTFSVFGVHGVTAITAVTAQNTVEIRAVQQLSPELVEAQIVAVVEDIGVDAAKTGMLGGAGLVERVAGCVRRYAISNLVVDPVMTAKTGDTLLAGEARQAVLEALLPVTLVVTPNLPEASILTGRELRDPGDRRDAARFLHDKGARWVVLKGGHLPNTEDAVDLLFDGRAFEELRVPRTVSVHTHGTGCALSAAVAAGLARGDEPAQAIRAAKSFITRAIAEGLPLGRGHGPVNVLAGMRSPWTGER
jgi:hydroxymethylpyrimidine/phosphomethylpyrimidine kinase